jgi:hypothetical protein
MLEVGDATTLNEAQWKLLAATTRLPKGVADYLASPSAQELRPNSRRRFNRQPLRGIAILIIGDERHAAFTKDLSRTGLGFFAPTHLFPKRVVQLWLPQGRILRLRITRCVRRAVDCFECGSVFDLGDGGGGGGV